MREAFTKEARVAVKRAEDEARAAGSRTIEAEHLLLAVSDQVGLDRTQVEAALAAEWRASLDAAGVDLVPPPPVPRRGRIKFGASAKRALEEALNMAKIRKDRSIGVRHVAMGTLRPRLGRVQRAVTLAEIDTKPVWRR